MQLDITKKEVILEIQKELKENGDNLSIQEISTIVSSQFTACNLAFKKGLEVRLPAFGTFVRKHGEEKGIAGRELNKLRGTFDDATMKRKVLELQLKTKKEHKKGESKRRSKMGTVTFKVLQNTKDKVHVKNKYDKVL